MADLGILGFQFRDTYIEDNPELADLAGTWEILAELSDNTLATPMGGEGFPTKEAAERACARVRLDGGSLVVSPLPDAETNPNEGVEKALGLKSGAFPTIVSAVSRISGRDDTETIERELRAIALEREQADDMYVASITLDVQGDDEQGAERTAREYATVLTNAGAANVKVERIERGSDDRER